MNLLERYLFAVSQRLPRNMREDVTAELRSLLLDMIENKGDVADDTAVVAILQEFGSPDQVAAAYRPHPQYLIGPDFYPFYTKIVQIVTGAMSIAFLVIFILSLVSEGQSWLAVGQTFIDIFPNYVSSLLTGVGVVTVIFVLLERYAPDTAVSLNAEFAAEQAAWDPQQLPPINHDNQIDRFEIMTEIVATFLGLVFINWVVRQYGVVIFEGNEWQTLPILTDAFYTVVLPLMNIVWISEILFNIYLLRQKEWTVPSRWLEIGLQTLQIGVLGLILANLPLLEMDPAKLAAAGWPATHPLIEAFTIIVPLFNIGIRIGLIVGMVLLVLSIGKRLFKLLRQPESDANKVMLA